jgi:His/Glu/Gln/Arg/opine family amino acid ABC transporter permease subunit
MLYGYLPAILEGLWLTLRLAAVSLAIACGFGLLGAVAKLSASRAARTAADLYTTLIRGLPELVLMLLIFYGGQSLVNNLAQRMGREYVDINPFLAGTVTIGFIFGAYLTETFRGAILAIPRGQMEAGHAFDSGLYQQLAGDGQGHRARLHYRAGRYGAQGQSGFFCDAPTV